MLKGTQTQSTSATVLHTFRAAFRDENTVNTVNTIREHYKDRFAGHDVLITDAGDLLLTTCYKLHLVQVLISHDITLQWVINGL